MSENDVQRQLRERFNLRLGPEMAAYVLRQLGEGLGEVSLIAADARTGIPLRAQLPAAELRAVLQTPPSSQR